MRANLRFKRRLNAYRYYPLLPAEKTWPRKTRLKRTRLRFVAVRIEVRSRSSVLDTIWYHCAPRPISRSNCEKVTVVFDLNHSNYANYVDLHSKRDSERTIVNRS